MKLHLLKRERNTLLDSCKYSVKYKIYFIHNMERFLKHSGFEESNHLRSLSESVLPEQCFLYNLEHKG